MKNTNSTAVKKILSKKGINLAIELAFEGYDNNNLEHKSIFEHALKNWEINWRKTGDQETEFKYTHNAVAASFGVAGRYLPSKLEPVKVTCKIADWECPECKNNTFSLNTRAKLKMIRKRGLGKLQCELCSAAKTSLVSVVKQLEQNNDDNKGQVSQNTIVNDEKFDYSKLGAYELLVLYYILEVFEKSSYAGVYFYNSENLRKNSNLITRINETILVFGITELFSDSNFSDDFKLNRPLSERVKDRPFLHANDDRSFIRFKTPDSPNANFWSEFDLKDYIISFIADQEVSKIDHKSWELVYKTECLSYIFELCKKNGVNAENINLVEMEEIFVRYAGFLSLNKARSLIWCVLNKAFDAAKAGKWSKAVTIFEKSSANLKFKLQNYPMSEYDSMKGYTRNSSEVVSLLSKLFANIYFHGDDNEFLLHSNMYGQSTVRVPTFSTKQDIIQYPANIEMISNLADELLINSNYLSSENVWELSMKTQCGFSVQYKSKNRLHGIEELINLHRKLYPT